jgi:DNA-binding NarL/FixJ family response regulator
MSAVPPKRVAVVDEHEVFRLGIRAVLIEDPMIDVVYAKAAGPVPQGIDVAVVSARALERERFHCPVVVCANALPPSARQAKRNRVVAVLPRDDLQGEQLIAAVRAAAAGLRVNSNHSIEGAARESRLDPRRREVLRMLAEGADTHAISQNLCYSVRTIKSLIADIEHELCAASRAHAVAEAIRQGII